MKTGYELRLGYGADHSYVQDCWLMSYGSSQRATEVGSVYVKEHKALIRELLARPTVNLRVANDPSDPDAILGWACTEAENIMHYVYVRHAARRLGIAKALLSPYMQGDCWFTHKPETRGLPIPAGWRYNPYKLHCKNV